MDYEEKYERLQVLKKFRENIGLFGKLCFSSALKKQTPDFHHEIYRNLRNRKKDEFLLLLLVVRRKVLYVPLFFLFGKLHLKLLMKNYSL